MPRTLKRRADVANVNESPSASPEPPRQRRRSSSAASSAADSDISADPEATQTQAQSQSNTQALVKKLVRLALSTEYARLALRRSDITQKVLKDNNASHKLFKPVFAGAQKILQETFGMTLMELPSREKTTLKDRRTQATQATQLKSQQGGAIGASSNKSWILVSTLPDAYKQNPIICPPARASSQEQESEYTALYTFVLALIYLNNSVLTDAKLERYLKRVNADTWTPAGMTDKLLLRMMKEGYIEKRRDTSSGEDIVEWVIGPRGKVEVGVRGVAGLVKRVYGFGAKGRAAEEGGDQEEGGGAARNGVKIEEEELDRRLQRSLGIKQPSTTLRDQQPPQQMDVDDEEENTERPRRGPSRR